MIEILSKVKFSNSKEITSLVQKCISENKQLTICYLNFHHIINKSWNSFLKYFFQNDYMIFSDGIGISFAKRLLTQPIYQNNIEPGTDIYNSILKISENNKWRLFFLGGNKMLIHELSFAIHNKYPGLNNVEFENGYLEFNDNSTIEKINNFSPDILFVGMGVPIQEEWIERHRDIVKVPIVISCGGYLKFLSGITPRAPLWMRKNGLEWIHRMFTDIPYFWKRYIFGIPKFLFLIFKAYLKR